MSEFLVPPASKRDIQKLALMVRQRFGLENIAFFPVVEMIEVALPAFDSEFNFEIIEDSEFASNLAADYNLQHLDRIPSLQ